MLNIPRALHNDRIIRALTELNRQAFDGLCGVFGTVYEELLQANSVPRERARGGGRKARLQSTQAKVFFILFSFKCDPTFDVLGILFDLERGRSNRSRASTSRGLRSRLGPKNGVARTEDYEYRVTLL